MYFETDCKKCKKNIHCCIFKNNSGFTFIGIKDAERIKKTIKKDYSYFLDYSPLPKKIISAIKKDESYLEGALRYSQIDKKKILRLKTKKQGRCIFLNDKGKCDIYSIRPNICRIYPFWVIRLNNGKLKVIEHDINSGCSVIKSLNKKHTDLEKTLSKKEIKDIKKVVKDIEKENLFYKKNIKRFIESIS